MFIIFIFLVNHAWPNIYQKIEDVPVCEKNLECFSSLIGAKVENINEDGEILQQIETPDLILKTKRDFLGQFDHIDVYDKKTSMLLSQEWYGKERITLTYGEDSLPILKRIIRRLDESNNSYYEEILTQYEKGKAKSKVVKLWKGNSKVLEYSQCLRGIQPTATTARQLSRVVAGVFTSEATSASHIRLTNSDCPDSMGREVTESLKQGMACMLDSRQGGTVRSQRDVGLLLSLMSNPAKAFTVKCFQGGAGIPGHGHVHGSASMCNSSEPGLAAYPGINLDLDTFRGSAAEKSRSLRSTIYHEMLHTLGYPHGHAPDVSYWCEYCCFTTGSASLKQQACNLCRQPDSPPASYIGDMFKYAQDSFNTGLEYSEDFAYLSMEDYARNLFARDGNKNAAEVMADSIIAKCPRGEPARCGFQMAKAALVMLKAQEALANAGTTGVAPLSSAQRLQITQLSTVFSGATQDIQAATIVGGVMAGYIIGGSRDYARRFVSEHMRTACQAIPADEKPYVEGALPPAFQSNFGLQMETFMAFACP